MTRGSGGGNGGGGGGGGGGPPALAGAGFNETAPVADDEARLAAAGDGVLPPAVPMLDRSVNSLANISDFCLS